MIKAAGAILWRRTVNEEIEVALVHRPKYDDWTFPKGILEKDETYLMCAYREVREETGCSAHFGRYLGAVTYLESGAKKLVKYWAAQSKNPSTKFQANAEIDAIEWVTPKEAKGFLTYQDDRKLMKLFRGLEVDTKTYIFLRHATAFDQGDWERPDSDRPLNELGLMQAKKLIDSLVSFGITSIVSSDAHRCRATIEPFAQAMGLQVKLEIDLSAKSFEEDQNISISYLRKLIENEESTLICSHNPIIPRSIKVLTESSYSTQELIPLNPADAWIMHTFNNEILSLELLKAPKVP